MNLNWVDSKYVALKSEENGLQQEFHKTSQIKRLKKHLKSLKHCKPDCLLHYETTLCFLFGIKRQKIVLNLEVGDMVVFRGDVNHTGAGYKSLNYRIHVALTV